MSCSVGVWGVVSAVVESERPFPVDRPSWYPFGVRLVVSAADGHLS